MSKDSTKRMHLSKFLSFVLRHEPTEIGLELDSAGWVDIDDLINACTAHGKPMTRELLEEIVATSPKQRFALHADGRRIRASQGHSIDVDLGYEPASPPDLLYHGTIESSLQAIRCDGLRKMARHHVHLSADVATARAVASRRGAPIILTVLARAMHRDGHVFYLSANGVWLTEHVPTTFLRIQPPEDRL